MFDKIFNKYEVIENAVINSSAFNIAFNDTTRKGKPIKFKKCKINSITLDKVPKNSVFVNCEFKNIIIIGNGFAFYNCKFGLNVKLTVTAIKIKG